MANKRLWLGMLALVLALVLAFGMTVVGCGGEEEPVVDTDPSPPAGLAGTAENNSVRLIWNSVNNADEYLVQYKENSSTSYKRVSGTIKTANYTVTDLDFETKYDFQVAVKNTDGYTGKYSSPVSVTTGSPLTGNVSVSMETTCNYFSGGTGINPYSYIVVITLKLSDGAYWDRDRLSANASNEASLKTLFKSWVTMSGTPDVSTWDVGLYTISASALQPQTIRFSFISVSASDNVSISGLTAAIVTSKLAEMKGYTNVINSLTSGTPSSASSSAWVKNF